MDASTRLTRRLAARFWPGPLSLICAGAAAACRASGARRRSGTVAIRVPDHRVARLLAAAFGGPITSTSANPSGAAAARGRVETRTRSLAARVFVIDGGPTPGGAPSTIVDARTAPARLDSRRGGAVGPRVRIACKHEQTRRSIERAAQGTRSDRRTGHSHLAVGRP